MKQDNRASVSRHCVFVCVEGWGTDRRRGGMTKQRPKGPFLKQTIGLLCVFVRGQTCVFPDLNYTDVP